MKILVPDTIDLDLVSSDGLEVVTVSAQAGSYVGHEDAEMLVVWQNSPTNLAAAARELPNLLLVQALAAGPDAVLQAGFADGVLIASGRGLHDIPVAEHTLALTLAAVRRLTHLADEQRAHRWDSVYNPAQADPVTAQQYTLHGATVAIWGFGSIAALLAPMLTALGAQVVGIATTAGERHGFTVVASGSVDELLARTDVLISLVPHTADTESLFSAELFGRLKHGAVFINSGRGRTVDEAALIAALESGQLRAAAVDVTREEPLPAESDLWDAPNLLVTPHIAGNRPVGARELVAANAAALASGEGIRNLVAR